MENIWSEFIYFSYKNILESLNTSAGFSIFVCKSFEILLGKCEW